MKLKQFLIISVFAGFGAIACGGPEGELSESTLAVDDDDDSDSDSCESDSDLREIFRDATRRYRNTNNLAPDGFVQLQPECFTEEFTEGGGGTIELGIVFLRPNLIDGVIDP